MTVADSVALFYSTIAGVTLLVYDTILTFSSEREFIWAKEKRLAAIFYSLARYLTLMFLLIWILLATVPMEFNVCTAIYKFSDALAILPPIGIHGLLILRTYATSGRNKWILGVLLFLILGSVSVYIPQTLIDTCLPTVSQSKTLHLEAEIGGGFITALDTAVLVVTVYYTVAFRKLEGMKGSLMITLLQQGIIRYIFVLTFNVTSLVCLSVLRPSIAGIVAPVQNSLSAIIICRFMLNIRRQNEHQNTMRDIHIPSSGFKGVMQRFDDIVTQEFADHAPTGPNESAGPEELEEGQSEGHGTTPIIDVREYPWASGDLRDSNNLP